MFLDYYKILEVHHDASFGVIEKAYKVLCLKYHPDKHPKERQRWAHEKMQALNEAYRVISNPTNRKYYDEQKSKLMWNVFLEEGLIGIIKVLLLKP
ncbi:J domain-containing protein [Candidatus Oleimmundimicrobium sp.]|uniref:J domain-containing protein n=1 Tax=Candidatus Oleimmundimicrobium sp. TaxID=3060597 RepID=UPI002723E60F|nr:J domain-containing protein [Candidatus Oleimmundimicrobium sp.]MDO8886500.1 J domain-containing protein [Candidatus Oleimmundimicrobium sp.]